MTSIIAVPVKLLVLVTRHSLPSLGLIAMLVLAIAWYNVGFDHAIERATVAGRGFLFLDTSPQHILTDSYRWLLGVPIAAVIVIDFIAVSLFARRWRARRWGHKPPEIERATRYFHP